MKTPLFRNHNDGRVYDADNRTMFFVNDPTTAEEIIKIVNDNAALRSEIARLEALNKKHSDAYMALGDMRRDELANYEIARQEDARRLEQVTAEREAYKRIIDDVRAGNYNNAHDIAAARSYIFACLQLMEHDAAALKGGKG